MHSVDLAIALAGAVLGGLFFGGLWWSTQRATASTQPAAWVAGSLMLRLAIALPGFYLLGGGHWNRLLACLLGFVAARVAITRLLPTRTPHAP